MRPTAAALFLCAFLLVSCNVPVLESASCTTARDELKKLYSLHFDQGPEKDEASRKLLERYVSLSLQKDIDRRKGFDYLTQTTDFPKAFRIGECREEGKERLRFGMLLFWKEPGRDEQKAISIEMTNEESRWVVDKVRPEK